MRGKIRALAIFMGLIFLFSAEDSFQQQNIPKKLPQRCPLNPDLLNPPSPEFGLIPHTMDLSHLNAEVDVEGIEALPSAWDWRNYGGVTPAKDQSHCNVCWIFAATGILESKVLIESGEIYDFSEENLKECHSWNRGCFGGTIFIATGYHTVHGTVTEACNPYNPDSTGFCNSSCPKKVQVTGFRLIGNDVSAIKAAVYNNGPCYATMNASFPGFSSYDGSYVLYYTGNEGSNHSIMIVGWDDYMSHEGGTGAWICKNSWGTEWGDNGFFYIAYGSAKIGGMASYYSSCKNYDYSENIYHYDEGGWFDSYGFEPSDSAWGLVKFTASRDEYIDAVDFWKVARRLEYTIYIYDSFDGNDLSNLLHSQSGTIETESGYYSIPLTNPCWVAKGDDFVVVVKFRTPNYSFPVPTDSCDINAPIESGKCFMSPDGSPGSWVDTGLTYDRDIGIRARTKSQPLTAPAAPSNLAAQAVTSEQIDLSWIDNSNNEDSFKIERSEDGINFIRVATVDENVETYADTGLIQDTQYWYRIRAYNSEGNSGYSNVSSDITFPATPNQLSISTATGAPAIGSGGTTNPAPGVYTYSSGSHIIVNSLPNQNFRFSRWNGDVNLSGKFDGEITVYMDSDKSISANFCAKCGDVNGDLYITPGDAQRAFEIYLGRMVNPTKCELENADVNCDGTQTVPRVTPADAHAIFNRYLRLSGLPTDCLGTSRAESAASISILRRRDKNINILIDIPQAVSDEIIVIPVIIDDPYDLTAFGFDLIFPSGILKFVDMEKTEFSESLECIDANVVAQGVVRVGGYKIIPIKNRFPVRIELAFEIVGEIKEPIPISIMNAVDDIAHSFVKTKFFCREQKFRCIFYKKF